MKYYLAMASFAGVILKLYHAVAFLSKRASLYLRMLFYFLEVLKMENILYNGKIKIGRVERCR